MEKNELPQAFWGNHPPCCTQQTQDVSPMLNQCWANVADGGLKLNQRWTSLLCLLVAVLSRHADNKTKSMLTQCWLNAGHHLQCWTNISRHWVNVLRLPGMLAALAKIKYHQASSKYSSLSVISCCSLCQKSATKDSKQKFKKLPI